MFKILRFRRGAGWNPEVHGVYDDAEEGYVRQTARGILATTTEGVVVIVLPGGEVEFAGVGFAPLDIEERIWRALDRADLHRPAEAGEKRRPGDEEQRASCVQLDTVACELEQEAADDRAHGGALAMAASLVRQHLALHGQRAKREGEPCD